MTTETKADEFKVGDIVWCLVYGKGEVGDILKDDLTCPMEVLFDSGDANWYTKDGRFSKEANRTIFFSEPKIEASVTRPFVPTLVGKTVIMEYYDGSRARVTITAESKDEVFYGSGSDYKSDLTAIYEVSSENLLK